MPGYKATVDPFVYIELEGSGNQTRLTVDGRSVCCSHSTCTLRAKRKRVRFKITSPW